MYQNRQECKDYELFHFHGDAVNGNVIMPSLDLKNQVCILIVRKLSCTMTNDIPMSPSQMIKITVNKYNKSRVSIGYLTK